MSGGREPPAYLDWADSTDNPVRGASEAARYFIADALRAAFNAGKKRGAWEQRRHDGKNVRENIPDIFT